MRLSAPSRGRLASGTGEDVVDVVDEPRLSGACHRVAATDHGGPGQPDYSINVATLVDSDRRFPSASKRSACQWNSFRCSTLSLGTAVL